MIHTRQLHNLSRLLLFALPLALSLVFLSPGTSEAHAILLKSDPAKDAILTTAPSQVRMWFSEDLNPATSTAFVVNANNQRVDVNGSLVLPNATREMDVSLQPNLPPDVYVVIWRTQSATDGHVLRGSFIFSIAEPNGTVPHLHGQVPGQDALGGNTSTEQHIDLIAWFNFLMTTLVEIGTVFWVGAQMWHSFVLQPAPADQQTLDQQAEQRFASRFSLPTLRVLFIANIGILLAQGLSLTGGRWDQLVAPTLLLSLITNGHFGALWVMREVIITLAMVLGAYMVVMYRQARRLPSATHWLNLILALGLLIVLALSSHAASVTGTLSIYAILSDWLHLLAAALWVGGMLYLAQVYLPLIKADPVVKQSAALLSILPRYSPMAIVGVVLMGLTGPFNAAVQINVWNQLITTLYGLALDAKVLFVGAMIITSAVHIFFWRPRLANTYKKLQARPLEKVTDEASDAAKTVQDDQISTLEEKLLANDLTRQTKRMINVLRWEPLLGIAVLVCTGLLTIFAGTLMPTQAMQPSTQQPSTVQQVKPYTTTVTTTDGKFTVKLTVTPNRFGPNEFIATVFDKKSGKQDTDVGVSLYTTMLTMDMGTDTVNLQPDGKGNFTANGDLAMAGDWQIRIQIRTPDDTLHETKFKFTTSS